MKNVVLLRDAKGVPLMLISHSDSIDIIVYTDKLIKVQVKKNSPDGEKILTKKIENGVVTVSDLLKYAK